MENNDELHRNYDECRRLASAKNRLPTIIFVGGAARSGTTLLQAILCSSPETNHLIPESVIFRTIVEAYMAVKRNAEKFPEI
jgi:2-phosphoglycerate kinase